MRALGYWLGKNGIPVINNVRWGNSNTWGYCYDGVDMHSVIAIGSSASNPRLLDNRPLFEEGLIELIHRLKPTTIIVYGSVSNSFFEIIRNEGVQVIAFSSQTNQKFGGDKRYE